MVPWFDSCSCAAAQSSLVRQVGGRLPHARPADFSQGGNEHCTLNLELRTKPAPPAALGSQFKVKRSRPKNHAWAINLLIARQRLGLRQCSGAFGWLASIAKAPEDRRAPEPGGASAKVLPASCRLCFSPIGLPARCRQHPAVHGEPPFVLRMHWDHEPTRPRARPRLRTQTTQSRTRTSRTTRTKPRFMERKRLRHFLVRASRRWTPAISRRPPPWLRQPTAC
jgi:hypothetical protein